MSALVTFREVVPKPASVLALHNALGVILHQCNQLGLDPTLVDVEFTETSPVRDQREPSDGAIVLCASVKL